MVRASSFMSTYDIDGSIDRADRTARAARSRQRVAVEWPTLALALGLYASWLALIALAAHVSLWIIAPLTAIVVAWQSSLQHEILHGHPTRSRRVNRWLGMVPLTLWLPYERYKQTHLQHHVDERLTDPLDDPESRYVTPEDWARLSPLGRAILKAQATLAGRLIIGPFWAIGRFWLNEADRVIDGEPGARRIWLEHALWCVPVIAYILFVGHLPIWLYVLTIAVPATSIMLIRSFCEHKAVPGVRERVAIVENARILGPIFLFNNLHSLHHEDPTIPWYRYPAYYRANRERLIAENGGLVYDSYLDIARRFLFKPHDQVEHPMGRIPREP